MLPGLTLPASWRVLLETFRPAFRRSSTFALFVLLATGLVAQAARRTVVGMLAGAGMAAVVSFHACCRFFSPHAWDVDRIGLALARLIVTGCSTRMRRSRWWSTYPDTGIIPKERAVGVEIACERG